MREHQSVNIRQISRNRAEQVGYYRFLENENVTLSELVRSLSEACEQQVEGLHVLAISDTSEINLQSHAGRLKPEGLGVVGNDQDLGFFMHPTLGLNAETGFPLGLSHVLLSLPKILSTLSSPMTSSPSEPILPIVIVPLEEGKEKEPPDLRHWQIEEFLRQTGKSDNTQRVYRGQLMRFAAWCDKSWLDVTPSDIGKYRRELKLKGLKATSVNHALNTLKAFYGWLRRSNGYPMNKPLPTDAIDLERQPEPEANHIDADELAQIWQVLEFEEKTAIRDRAIIAILSHGLRASEASNLDVEHWNSKILKVHRSKGQNVSEVPLNREARQYLKAYLEWRQQQGGMFDPVPESPMFLAQDPKSAGKRLGYKGLHRMVKKVGKIAGVESQEPVGWAVSRNDVQLFRDCSLTREKCCRSVILFADQG